MPVNPWPSKEVNSAFEHYKGYVLNTSVAGFNEHTYKKHFPNFDIYKITDPGFRVAEYVHVNYFKQFGHSDIKHRCWQELSEWYHRIIMAGAMVAYKLIENNVSSYDIDMQCNNVQSMLVNGTYTENMIKLFEMGYAADNSLFDSSMKYFSNSMQIIRGDWADDGQLVTTILYRNFMHGYFGFLLSNTYLSA